MLSRRTQTLHLAAGLADRAPVSLGEALTGIDDRNVALLVLAIRHASGATPVPLLATDRGRAAIRDG